MLRSFPERVVASAAARISSKCSSTHPQKSRAPRALSNMNTGARCMRSSMIVVVTPPASYSNRMPRL
jgi:hypothetical protein